MKTVVEKLFENADRHPDKLAVVFENEEITYGQLKDAGEDGGEAAADRRLPHSKEKTQM